MGIGTLVIASFSPLPALATPGSCQPSYDLDVTLDPGAGRLAGRMTLTLECDGPPPDEIALWLYPNRLATPPELLDAMTTYWIYPYSFNPGGMEIQAEGVRELELDEDHPLHAVPGMAVSVPLEQGEDGAARVEVTYEVRIPKRYGLFGRARGGVLLATGWHPMLAPPGPAGWNLDAAPAEARYDVTLRVKGGYDVVLGDLFSPSSGSGKDAVIEASTGPVSALPLAAYPDLETSKASCKGVTVRWHGLGKRPQAQHFTPGTGEVLGLPDKLPDVMSYDRPLMAMETACRVVHLAREAGVKLAKGTVLDLLEAPLRLEVAAPTHGPVVVSDRAFDILPAKKAWKFHEFQIARAVAVSLLMRTMRGSGDPVQEAVSADFLAAEIVKRYTERYHGTQEDVVDILKWGSFLAAVDYFLYSPLVEFREAYFMTVAERDWLRDEPWAFMSRMPRGKLFHHKLVDLLGAEAVDRIADGFVQGKGTIRALAQQEAGEDLDWFWTQWSTAYPSLNYRVGSVTSTPAGSGYRHEARIERQGDTSIREPVTVRFLLAGGGHEDRVWLDSGASGTVSMESDHKLEKVVVDPEMRLFEDASLTKNHPRFDNASKASWRPPVFAAFAITSNITDLSGDIDVLFDMRRKYDVISGLRMRLVAATWGQGGTIWYSHGLGKKRDMDHAVWHVGGFVTGFHHNPGFGYLEGSGEDAAWHGGTSFTAGLYLDHDNRHYPFNPTDGWNFGLGASYSMGLDDDKWSEPGSLRHVFSASTRAFYLWTPTGGHTLAFYGGASGNFGDPYRGQLESLSSPSVLRGFDVDETFGRALVYACFEYRHLYTHALNINVVHYATLQGIQGVLFGGAGTVTREDSYRGLFAADRIFTEVGYGLRGIIAFFGSYPGIVALDLAVPITPLERYDRYGQRRLPVALRLSFNHTF
ncbi:MAG: hypothetical protein JRG91_04125 [Deltaproteobacteria bacterium]|nr:hypothetical protein [Deltaproteobacteria bacterium]